MSKASYFPSQAITPDYAEFFSDHLLALGELPIYDLGNGVTAYRFLWLRTFDPAIAIRAEFQNQRGLLRVKQTDGESGFETGRLIVDTCRHLTDADWARITARVQETNFWDLPAENFDLEGLDGAEWVIEGILAGRYHVCHRWSELAQSSIADLGLLLLELSGIHVDEIY